MPRATTLRSLCPAGQCSTQNCSVFTKQISPPETLSAISMKQSNIKFFSQLKALTFAQVSKKKKPLIWNRTRKPTKVANQTAKNLLLVFLEIA